MLFLLFDVFFRPAGVWFADGGGRNEPRASCSPPQWGGGELRGSKNRKIHTRQQRTAAERISEKGRSRRRSVKNRRIFDPQKCKASDLAKSQERPRNRFTAAAFRLPFGRAKGNVYYLGIRASARRGCGPRSSRTAILQNLSSAAAGVAPKVRAAEDNTAKRCADACVFLRLCELRGPQLRPCRGHIGSELRYELRVYRTRPIRASACSEK